MADGRQIAHVDEALVLRTWPFHEADLLVSLFTRSQGRVKGVARHAMKSRRRFGGALEPATHVRAQYTERPKQDLVRLDSFEILWSPLTAPVDLLRAAGMQLVVEVLEEALPEQAPEDNVFRLALAVLRAMEGWTASREQGRESRSEGLRVGGEGEGEVASSADCRLRTTDSAGIWLPVTYFCVWMNRLMGWWPELGHCSACGLDLRGEGVWWSSNADGVTCIDDRKANSRLLSNASVAESYSIARASLVEMRQGGEWPPEKATDLRLFALSVLERNLERRLRSAATLL